jgi:hypothetical protein
VSARQLSLASTGALMILCKAAHPPAGATTLIISLGIVTRPVHLLVIEVAVAVLTLQAIAINRLAGIDYPLRAERWSSLTPGSAITSAARHRLLPVLLRGRARRPACWPVWVTRDPRGVSGFFYHARMVGIVHLVTLGWITASILGSLYIVGLDCPADVDPGSGLDTPRSPSSSSASSAWSRISGCRNTVAWHGRRLRSESASSWSASVSRDACARPRCREP